MQSPRVRFFVDLRCKFNGMECAIRAVNVLQNYLLCSNLTSQKSRKYIFFGYIRDFRKSLGGAAHHPDFRNANYDFFFQQVTNTSHLCALLDIFQVLFLN